jgi:hypothetical protein
MNLIALIVLLSSANPAQAEGGLEDSDAAAKAKNKAAASSMVTPDAKPEKPEKPELDVSKMPFTRDSIKQVVDHSLDKIQGCYEETLADKDQPVEGKLMTSFIVTPEGLVKKAKIEKVGTTLKDSRLHACVVAVLSTLTFPKPPNNKEYRMEYPFNLKAIR